METVDETYPLRELIAVPSLPMRDGNITLGIEWRVFAFGSEPTYEGWKPSVLEENSSFTRRFRAYL